MKNKTVRKLFIGLFVAFFIPFILGSIFVYNHEKKIRKDNLLLSTERLLHGLKQSLAEPTNTFAPQEVARIAHLLTLNPSIVEIFIYSDEYGIALAHIDIQERREGEIITREEPIFFENRAIGKVQLSITTNVIEKEILPRLRDFFLVLLAMYLTGFLTITIIFTRKIATPMHKLLLQTEAINNGQMDKSFSWTGNDEFAKLGRTIETMRTNLFFTFKKLHNEAHTDPLTGISNRRDFIHKATNALTDCRQQNKKFSLIMIDLDNFKQVNDTYGHAIGDKALNTTSQLLQANIRREDLFARWGGEEFILALPGTSHQQARMIAEKLRQLIATATYPMGIRITGSFGFIQAEGQESFQTLLKLADQAMYLAKQQGKNRVIQCKAAESCVYREEEA